MANVRGIKKDIDFLVSQVVVDCFQYINHFENADKEAAYKIVEGIMQLRSQLRQRASRPDGKDNPSLVKKHFNLVGKDLLGGCDKAYADLGKLVGKGE